jgi:hypothetical protein
MDEPEPDTEPIPAPALIDFGTPVPTGVAVDFGVPVQVGILVPILPSPLGRRPMPKPPMFAVPDPGVLPVLMLIRRWNDDGRRVEFPPPTNPALAPEETPS